MVVPRIKHRAIIACEHTSNCKRPTCVHIAAGSFVQANYGAFQSALASIRRHLPPGSRVVELHAGVGAIGLSLIGPTAAPQARGSKGEARAPLPNASDSQRKEGPGSLRCALITLWPSGGGLHNIHCGLRGGRGYRAAIVGREA